MITSQEKLHKSGSKTAYAAVMLRSIRAVRVQKAVQYLVMLHTVRVNAPEQIQGNLIHETDLSHTIPRLVKRHSDPHTQLALSCLPVPGAVMTSRQHEQAATQSDQTEASREVHVRDPAAVDSTESLDRRLCDADVGLYHAQHILLAARRCLDYVRKAVMANYRACSSETEAQKGSSALNYRHLGSHESVLDLLDTAQRELAVRKPSISEP
ncbi:hypothetical protein OPT61_g10000 [Boeremia exigua]|uniref:Uncharacterized protein n=1 Tax=Boeremia exigua TaxID=749465 RepID=A0ACC2HRN7_9PLEO|nr:hypothetical protein OPT61_g10000 [Boeremia exigua]